MPVLNLNAPEDGQDLPEVRIRFVAVDLTVRDWVLILARFAVAQMILTMLGVATVIVVGMLGFALFGDRSRDLPWKPPAHQQRD